MAITSYKIRTSMVTGGNGHGYPTYTVSLPKEIAEPLHEAGFRVRYEVREDCIAIIPVPVETVESTPLKDQALSLVNRITNGKEA
jgi:hypothetical protein